MAENENPVDDVSVIFRRMASVVAVQNDVRWLGEMVHSRAAFPLQFNSGDELEHAMTTANVCDGKIQRALCREMRMIVVPAVTLFVVGATFLFASQSHFIPDSTDGVSFEEFPMVSTKLSTTESTTIQWKGPKDWVRLVVLPLVAEVGGFILFQAIGMPLFNPLLQAGRRLLCIQQPLTRVVASTFARTMPRSMRSVPRFVANLFKKRSRLSVASEFTNFVGNEEEL